MTEGAEDKSGVNGPPLDVNAQFEPTRTPYDRH